MPAPRRLDFSTVADAPAEADGLRAGGYEKLGNWDLSQVADHCAQWVEYEFTGYPPAGVAAPAFWVMRKTVGPGMLRKILESGTMKAGVPTAPQTVPPPDRDAAAEAAAVVRLRSAADRLAAHDGPVPDSPIFGPMTADQAKRLHAIHCAHHLGFLKPSDDPPASGGRQPSV